jgi:hypothetical protein
MAVTMNDIRGALDPEEPDYQEAAKLGPDALPHLEVLVSSGDAMLASKATYLASLIKDAKSADIVRTAAHSTDPVVRVAAASAAANMPASGSSDILVDLVGDPDPGVRKVARGAVPDKPTDRLSRRLEELGDQPAAEREADGPGAPPATGRMRGEAPEEAPRVDITMPGEEPTGMPGEAPGRMPGEQGKMPGE